MLTIISVDMKVSDNVAIYLVIVSYLRNLYEHNHETKQIINILQIKKSLHLHLSCDNIKCFKIPYDLKWRYIPVVCMVFMVMLIFSILIKTVCLNDSEEN